MLLSGDKTFGEDLHFITRVLQAGVRVHHFADDRGRALRSVAGGGVFLKRVGTALVACALHAAVRVRDVAHVALCVEEAQGQTRQTLNQSRAFRIGSVSFCSSQNADRCVHLQASAYTSKGTGIPLESPRNTRSRPFWSAKSLGRER